MALANNGCQTLTGWAWIPGSCTVIYTDENGAPNPIDFGQVLATKLVDMDTISTFGYNPATHTVTHNGSPFVLNCGTFGFNPANCELTYVDEKGNSVAYFIPQDQFVQAADGCSLTILPAKGGSITVPLGVPASQVSMALIDGKILEFNYKDKKCQIQLPNGIIGCEYTRASNSLALLFCDGQEKNIDFAKASLNCLVNPDGSQVISFNDGCSPALKQFNIPAVVLDTDNGNFDIASGILTINFGGDGNSGSVTMDVCDTVRRLCPATFTQINPDGSWSFMNTAGEIQEYPAPPNCKTHHASSPDVLDEANPPAVPSNPPATKSDGDTLVEHHPNGVAWFACVGGSWMYNFMHTQDGNCCTTLGTAATPIDAANPPTQPENAPATKSDRDVHIECHANGWCGYTCVLGQWVRNFCKVWPTYSVTSDDGSLEVTPSTDAQGVTTFDLSVNLPEDMVGCCHYHLTSTAALAQGSPTAIVGAPADKRDGDTAEQKHPNGTSNWTCVNGGWVLDFVCIDPVIPQIPPQVTKEDIVDGFAQAANSDGVSFLGLNPAGDCVRVMLPPEADPAKETFKPGETLPDEAAEVSICVLNSVTQQIEEVLFPAGGGQLPQNMVGCVQLDETDGSVGWFGKAPKARQEMFCPGEVLPPWAVGTTEFTYFDPAAVRPNSGGLLGDIIVVTLGAGDTVPPATATPLGDYPNGIQRDPCLHVDPCTSRITCTATNPAIHLRCVGAYNGGTPGLARLASMEVVHCDGSKNYFQPNKVSADGGSGTVNVDSSTPVGPLAGTEFCTFPFLTPPCGRQRITLSYVHGWNAFNDWDKPDNSPLFGRPEYSLDGGVTWIPMGWGGVDTVLDNEEPGGENEFNDEAEPLTNPGIVYEVCFRYNLLANPTTGGVIQLQAQTGKWEAQAMACCYGEESAVFNDDPLGDL